MKNYYRVMLGQGSSNAAECFKDGFIGADFGIDQDLSGKLPDNWREFNSEFRPIFLKNNPKKTPVGAGLSCGALWRVSKGIRSGDIVLCPDGSGTYHVGEVQGEYYYAKGKTPPHRRKVQWLDVTIPRSEMSDALQNSTGSIGTVSTISDYRDEIEKLMGGMPALAQKPQLYSGDPEIEDPVAFAMEKHLEAFLVANWSQTLLSKDFSILEDEGQMVGQQFQTDAGTIDVLAISKDKKRLLVVELKRGRASDAVVGQVLRYMGFVKEQIATPEQTVEGMIIALNDDPKMRWALVSVPSISFYRYEISFKLHKG
jgi:restriction system protein